MSTTHLVLACLISALPGPPGVRWEDAYLQLLPVDKTKCPTIDPIRDIAFQLFTRNNPLMPDVLKIGDDSALAHSHMNFSDPTVIFFHAFFESSTGTTAWTIKTAYLQRKEHNIILLNAPRLEAGPWYFTAARNTRVVGEYTATFIDYLVSRGLKLHSLHLLGLSLGAQMAGVAGSNVRSGRVPRITGMDPAGPIFTKLPNSLKLDKSDAEFVDVIHTDAGIFGYPRAVGHADYWPNQGISPQPGCHFPEIKKRNPDTVIDHWRSYQFYSESVVNENGFLAAPCKSWQDYVTGRCEQSGQRVHMGYNAPVTARGNYFLTTNPESPFSLEGNPQTLAESNKYDSHAENHSLPPTPSNPQYLLEENIRTSLQSDYSNHTNYNAFPFASAEHQKHVEEYLQMQLGNDHSGSTNLQEDAGNAYAVHTQVNVEMERNAHHRVGTNNQELTDNFPQNSDENNGGFNKHYHIFNIQWEQRPQKQPAPFKQSNVKVNNFVSQFFSEENFGVPSVNTRDYY